MRTTFAILVFAVCSVAIAPRALAHHGDAGYDTSKLVTVKGSVTEFHFQNPHIEIFIDVKKDDRSIEKWHGELNSPNLVSRMAGWSGKTLKASATCKQKTGGEYDVKLSFTLKDDKTVDFLEEGSQYKSVLYRCEGK